MNTRGAAAANIDPAAKPDQGNLPFENKAPEIEAFETPGAEVEVEVKPEPPKQKRATREEVTDLKAQVEALKQAEQLRNEENARLTRERDEAIARTTQVEGEVRTTKLSAEEATLATIETAMAGAKQNIETAKRAIASAVSQGDTEGQVEALDQLATARAYLSKLEDGQIEMKQRIEVLKQEPPEKPKVEASSDPIERMNIPTAGKDWLRAHREYATDNRKNAKLQAAHWDAVDEGHKPFSTEYFASVERILGLREPEVETEEEVEEEVAVERTPIVSAPVGRRVPGQDTQRPGTVRLTQAQVDAAKASGVTPAEYARNLLKLKDMKKAGHYGEH